MTRNVDAGAKNAKPVTEERATRRAMRTGSRGLDTGRRSGPAGERAEATEAPPVSNGPKSTRAAESPKTDLAAKAAKATVRSNKSRNPRAETLPKGGQARTSAGRPPGAAATGARPVGGADHGAGGGDEVRVRMYRQGLGDCFLLTFPGHERPIHVLIDCGVLVGQTGGTDFIRDVVEHLRGTTGGRIDLLIATHQHWDHLSAFVDAQDLFDEIELGSIWLAWTEDPSHPLARALRRDRKRRIKALRAALEGLQGTALGVRLSLGLVELLNFFGESAVSGVGGRSTEAALKYLNGRDDADISFLSPGGEPLEIPGVPGVRVFVLGPPEDATLLKRSNPSRRASEVYELAFGLSAEAGFLAVGGADERDLAKLTLPFDPQYRLDQQQAMREPFFQAHYGFDDGGADAWRRIDHDWLGAAGQLALQLDNDTNNTSLALAFELVESGRILLFPADAQVGNWLSWKLQTWLVNDEGEEREIRIGDIFERTVLYKVGHHGSHNATLKADGLEQMRHPELVAMIPVDKATARKQRWNMPFPSLLKRLKERTRGRVLRVDDGIPSDADLRTFDSLSRGERQAFFDAVTEDPLYVEYRIRV